MKFKWFTYTPPPKSSMQSTVSVSTPSPCDAGINYACFSRATARQCNTVCLFNFFAIQKKNNIFKFFFYRDVQKYNIEVSYRLTNLSYIQEGKGILVSSHVKKMIICQKITHTLLKVSVNVNGEKLNGVQALATRNAVR